MNEMTSIQLQHHSLLLAQTKRERKEEKWIGCLSDVKCCHSCQRWFRNLVVSSAQKKKEEEAEMDCSLWQQAKETDGEMLGMASVLMAKEKEREKKMKEMWEKKEKRGMWVREEHLPLLPG